MKKGVLLAIIVVSLVSSGARSADEPSLVEAYQRGRQELNETIEQKHNLLSELYEVRQELRDIEREKGLIQQEHKQVTRNVKGITGLVGKVGENVSKQKKKIKERLRTLYKFTGAGVARLILTSMNSATLDKNLRFLKILTDRDIALLRAYTENVQIYEYQSKELQEEVERLARISRKLKEKEKEARKKGKRKKAIIAKMDSKRLLKLAKLKRLRLKNETTKESQKALKRVETIENLLRPTFFERKGRLQKPISGRLVKRYGIKYDKPTRTRIRFKGNFYSASEGEKVFTPYFGKVAFAGEMTGYGKAAIVSHGEHYYTVYANLSELAVTIGDAVEPRAVIGYSGHSNLYSRDGIYFEIRHFSEPLDPNKWLTASVQGKK